MKIIFFILTFCFLTSCEKKKQEILKDEDVANNFNLDNFRDLNYEDTLFIKTRFSECGEWGGHDESMKLFYIKERKIALKFERNEVKNCSERDNKGNIIKNNSLEKEIVLSKKAKEAIMVYINKLMKSKFLDPNWSNSGNSFSVESSNGLFKLSTSNNHAFNIDVYNDLLRSLQIPESENFAEDF